MTYVLEAPDALWEAIHDCWLQPSMKERDTWTPKRQGETIQGTWRKWRRNEDGSQDINYAPPFVETVEGDIVWLPDAPVLKAKSTRSTPTMAASLSPL
jgi:hypothetical protein